MAKPAIIGYSLYIFSYTKGGGWDTDHFTYTHYRSLIFFFLSFHFVTILILLLARFA